ncbi:MAG: tetratricopeptide repeat protein [Candidatus Sericytochromatia bacterium]
MLTNEELQQYIKNGKIMDAISYYEDLSKKFPDNLNIYLQLASLYEKTPQWEKALDYYLYSEQLSSKNPFIYNNIGCLYLDRFLYNQAEEFFKKAVALIPQNPFFLANLASVYEKLNKNDLAIEAFNILVNLLPHEATFFNSLAVSLAKEKRYEEALPYQLKAVYLANNNIDYNYNLGVIYLALCKIEEAISFFRKTLELSPKNHQAHYNLGVSLLLLGKFEEGFLEYEWRYIKFPYMKAIYDLYWKGENLENRIIYVHAEQGLGDTIQFCRYLKMLRRKKPKKIVFYVQPELVTLIKSLKIADIVNVFPPPILYKNGYHVCLLSLPTIFKTTIKNIPVEKFYITSEKIESEKWKKRLSHLKGLKIGIIWKPNKDSKTFDDRSIELKKFLFLKKKLGLNIISLQKEVTKEEIEIMKGNNILDFSKYLENFSDTAALIQNLDLVIGVDTSVIHLSAAMGKRVFLLLPFKPDWRWLLEKNTSPWYPSIKIFRQKERKNWDNVFKELEKILLF